MVPLTFFPYVAFYSKICWKYIQNIIFSHVLVDGLQLNTSGNGFCCLYISGCFTGAQLLAWAQPSALVIWAYRGKGLTQGPKSANLVVGGDGAGPTTFKSAIQSFDLSHHCPWYSMCKHALKVSHGRGLYYSWLDTVLLKHKHTNTVKLSSVAGRQWSRIKANWKLASSFRSHWFLFCSILITVRLYLAHFYYCFFVTGAGTFFFIDSAFFFFVESKLNLNRICTIPPFRHFQINEEGILHPHLFK